VTATSEALFPLTADERVGAIRGTLEAAIEKAQTRADKAAAKVTAAEQELDAFDAAIAAVKAEQQEGGSE
jgi:hypothetical protein